MKQLMISVVIPVYNSEKYLRKCLDSVLSQTYRQLQIICVDDDSSDRSWEILEQYAAADSRIQIFRKENEGVSLSRNFALERARGEYVLFIDSDDWMDRETCACALEAMEESRADVVMWSYIREMGKESRAKMIFDSDRVFEGQAVRERLYRRMAGAFGEELAHPENADALCTVWGKLYRRELIEKHGIRFYDIREIGTYEDGLFNLDVFSHVRKAVFLNRHFYHYRRNNDASLTTAYRPDLAQRWDRLFELIRGHIEARELDPTFEKALENRIVLSLIPLGINETEKRAGMIETVRSIKTIISTKQYRSAILDFEKERLPLHWKIFFTFAQWNWAAGVSGLLFIIQKIRGR
ncbi:MAG: glycosyltransferase family 2 protein [Oscillospiraceae bacterium]|nr:glycosyltransferase family 2 protein [Oscillospiraceae bacterium]